MDKKTQTQDIKAATDVLGKTVTRQEMAIHCGVSLEEFQLALLDEDSDAYRPPPQFWKGDLAQLARERATELVELADDLEATAWEPATEEELEQIGNIILTEFDKIAMPGEDSEEVQIQWDEVEKNREERDRRMAHREQEREDELEELNEMFRRGIKKMV